MADLATGDLSISLETGARIAPIGSSSRPDSISQLEFAQRHIDEKYLSSAHIRNSVFFHVAEGQMEYGDSRIRLRGRGFLFGDCK
jgi:hypothetical protein